MRRRTYGNRVSSLEERIAGVEEELAERIGTVMAKFIRAVLNDLDLTDEQQAIADDVPAALPWERPIADSNKDRATNYTSKSDHAEYVVSRLKRDDPELAERAVRAAES